MSSHPYNPLAIPNLGKSIADALLEQPVSPLPPSFFSGAGVYVIYYYKGNHPLYVRESTKGVPIYVGKAVSKGARKGLTVTGETESQSLFKRLSEHAESIRQGADLDLADFSCRFLSVDDIWIPLGESLLINKFRPIWNVKIDGFGNHAPGSGRSQQKKSPWDVLHAGRPWANTLTGATKSLEATRAEIEAYIAGFKEQE